MRDKARDIAQLILKYIKKDLNKSEEKRLWEWINESEANQRYFESMTSKAELESILDQVEYPNKEGIWQKIATEVEQEEGTPLPYMINTPSRFRWWKYVAAAMVVILAGGGIYLLSNRSNGASKTETASTRFQNDVPPPTGNRTLLTLADGRVLALDSMETGSLAQQGNTRITKQADGRLIYQLKNAGTAFNNNTPNKSQTNNRFSDADHIRSVNTGVAQLFNTISTARGGSYQLQLPDGSLVWLNAASSLRFPTAFTGPERKVELMGEAYFEVKSVYVAGNKQKKIPFKVSIRSASGTDRGEIEVLGTKFNLNAYEDEQLIKTTLTEGSVRVRKGAASDLLKPGQQALFAKDDNAMNAIKIRSTPNEDEVLAWKNGLFQFENTSITEIMRNVSRWYDVSVTYEGNVKGGFYGTIPRNASLVTLLKVLELTDGVRFKVSDKNITVIP